MSLRLSATYRIQTQTPQLILNLLPRKQGARPEPQPRTDEDCQNRRSRLGWFSTPAPTSSTTPRAGSPTGAISSAVAAVVRSMLGISPSAWEEAQAVMGELPGRDRRRGDPAKGGGDR